MNTKEAQRALALLTAAWPQVQMPEATARLWFEMLADLEPNAAMAAANAIIRNDERFPSIARFRRTTESLTHKTQAPALSPARYPREKAQVHIQESMQALKDAVRNKHKLPESETA